MKAEDSIAAGGHMHVAGVGRSGTEELFMLVDETGRSVGTAPRRLCHGNPRMLHAVVHAMVFNRRGRVLLQKRAPSKDVQPGKWDTSVGGHMRPGETPDSAVQREMEEELGAKPDSIVPAYSYLWESEIETEFVRTYAALCEGPFRFDPGEIVEGRFWNVAEIEANLGKGVFTPNFEVEFRKMKEWLGGHGCPFASGYAAISAGSAAAMLNEWHSAAPAKLSPHPPLRGETNASCEDPSRRPSAGEKPGESTCG